MLKLLVITPTLGHSEYFAELKECFAEPAIEVVHVISAPEPIVDSIKKEWNTSVIVKDAGESGGMYGAINCALNEADKIAWDYFIYLNDDDRVNLKEILRIIERHPDADFLYGDFAYINENSKQIALAPICKIPSFCLQVWSIGLTPFSQQSIVLKRRLVEDTGAFNSDFRYAGDMDFYIRAFSNAKKKVYTKSVVGYFRIHNQQLSRNREEFEDEIKLCNERSLPNLSLPQQIFFVLFYRASNLVRIFQRILKGGVLRSKGLYY